MSGVESEISAFCAVISFGRTTLLRPAASRETSSSREASATGETSSREASFTAAGESASAHIRHGWHG